ncbi:MAG: ABC transporter permease subunit [Nitrospiraceae bacterium]|nr:ABC transporter permease subunit [Nitrospiraceae bacterium]
MRKHRILFLTILIIVTALLSSWILNFYTQKRILTIYQNSRESVVKIAHGYYKSYVDDLNSAVIRASHGLNTSGVIQPDFATWTRKIKTAEGLKASLLRVWWISPDGEILYREGEGSQAGYDFSTDPMFSAAKESAYSDLYSNAGKVYLRTICPVAADGKEYILAVDTEFGEQFVMGIKKIVGEDVAFLYGHKIFASSDPRTLGAGFSLPTNFLNAVSDRQEAGAGIVEHGGVRYLITAFPVLDFDEWDTKGFIALVYPESALIEAMSGIRLQLWLGTVLAILLLAAGIMYIIYRVKKELVAKSEGGSRKKRFKRRMWLIACLSILPIIGVFIYVSFIPAPALMARFNQDRISIGAREVKNETEKWTVPLSRVYGRYLHSDEATRQELTRIKDQGGFDFVVLHEGGTTITAGKVPRDYSEMKADIARIPDRTPRLMLYKRTLLFLTKEETPHGMLVYGFTITKDVLTAIEDRTAAGITIFVGGKPVVSTIASRVLRTLELLPSVSQKEGISFRRGKLREIYHELAFIPLTSQASKSSLDGVLMVSVDDTPFQNSITGYHFIVFALIIAILLVAGISLFVVLNVDRPRLLRSEFTGYAFLSPALIHLFWWAVGPLLFAIYLAFHHWSIINPAKPFVGLGNFIELMHDGLFWHSMLNTAIYTLQVPIGMALSLAIALAVNRKVRGIRLLRTVYYLPAVSSLVVTSIMWRWIYNPDFGILNYLLSFLGIPKLPWLTSPYMAMPAIMIMSIWMVMGQNMIIFLAGLQSIPPEYHEAASVDGANGVQRFWYITLPLLKPTTFFVLVTSVIGSFQVFTPVYVLTQGGPLRSTDVAVYHIWQAAWQELRMGYAAAESWILFAVILVFTFVEFRLLGKGIRYV